MKIQIFLIALFLMPILTYSQQNEEKSNVLKKETSVKTVKRADLNQLQNQNTNPSQMIKPCSEAERISNGIPDDFPRCLNTGNKRQDEDNYYKAQEVWIKNNPERFKKIKNTSL
jgi:hypothetical protein